MVSSVSKRNRESSSFSQTVSPATRGRVDDRSSRRPSNDFVAFPSLAATSPSAFSFRSGMISPHGHFQFFNLDDVFADDDRVADRDADDGTKVHLAVICALALVLALPNSLIGPFFPRVAREHGIDMTMIGIIQSVFPFIMVVTGAPIGKLITLVGPKPVVIAGGVLTGVGTMAFALVDLFDDDVFACVSTAIRMVQGLGCAAYMCASQSMVISLFPKRVAKVSGVIEVCATAGYIIGPIVGGVLFLWKGFHAPFIAVGACSLVVLLPFALFAPRRSQSQRGRPSEVSMLHIVSAPNVPFVIVATVFGMGIIAFLDMALEPVLSSEGMSQGTTNAVFALVSIVYTLATPIVGLCSTLANARMMISAGLLLMALSWVVFAPAPLIPVAFPAQVTGVASMIVGFSMASMPVLPLLLFLTEDLGHGSSDVLSGVLSAAYGLGEIVFPIVGGFLFDTVGIRLGAVCIAASVTLVALVIVLQRDARYVEFQDQMARHPSPRQADVGDDVKIKRVASLTIDLASTGARAPPVMSSVSKWNRDFLSQLPSPVARSFSDRSTVVGDSETHSCRRPSHDFAAFPSFPSSPSFSCQSERAAVVSSPVSSPGRAAAHYFYPHDVFIDDDASDGAAADVVCDGSRAHLAVICALALVLALPNSLIGPFFPRVAREHGISMMLVGAIQSIFPLIMFMTGPFIAKLVTLIGPKPVVVAGGVLTGLATVAFALVDLVDGETFAAVCIAIRMVQGLGCAAYGCASQSMILTLFPKHVAKVSGVIEVCASAGYIIGPIMGGVLFRWRGFRAPFVVVGLCSLVAMLPLMLFAPRRKQSQRGRPSEVGTIHIITAPNVPFVLVATVFGMGVIGFLDMALEPVLSREGISPGTTNAVFVLISVVYAIATPIVGMYSTLSNARPMMAAGLLMMAASWVMFAPAPFVPVQFPIQVAAVTFMTIGFAMALMPVLPLMLFLTDGLGHGSSDVLSGVLSASYGLGEIFGPIIGGFMFDTVGIRVGSVFIGASVTLVALVVVMQRDDRYDEYQERMARSETTVSPPYVPLEDDHGGLQPLLGSPNSLP
ncbi:Major facilitator superfamily (MFS) profile domain-containing protein [Plasmodiophora brassicae]